MTKPHPDTCLVVHARIFAGKDGKSDSVTAYVSQLNSYQASNSANEFDPPIRATSFDPDVINAFRASAGFPCLARLSIRAKTLPARGEYAEKRIDNIVAASEFQELVPKPQMKAVA